MTYIHFIQQPPCKTSSGAFNLKIGYILLVFLVEMGLKLHVMASKMEFFGLKQ